MEVDRLTRFGWSWIWRNKFTALCCLFVLYMCVFSDHSICRIIELQQQEERLRHEIKVFRDSTESYQRRIDEVSVNEAELERYAREVLRMHKQNEELYLFE